jgi:hypothetical protein
MHVLTESELGEVSGAFNVHIDFGPIEVDFTGGEIASAYESAVSRVTDFFMWWDPEGLVQPNS